MNFKRIYHLNNYILVIIILLILNKSFNKKNLNIILIIAPGCSLTSIVNKNKKKNIFKNTVYLKKKNLYI